MIELLQWTNEYSVGVADIDDQHKKLFQLINEFLKSIAKNEQKQAITTAIEKMSSYVEYHFKHEETYLKKHPEYSQHHKEHGAFAIKTLKLIPLVNTEPSAADRELLEYLVVWLQNHVLGTDIKHFRYLKENKLI